MKSGGDSFCELCKTCSEENITLLSKGICRECEQTMVNLTIDHPCYSQYLLEVRQIWKTALT